jgi:hypothetical protein
VIPRRRVASQEHSPERGRPPRVFISYSHDSPEHARQVLGLADRLRNDGIDAILDQYEVSPKEGWMLWMEREIEQANYVLLVCTAPYLRRVMKREAKGVGLGVCWESHIVYQYLYEDGNLNWRFLPVLFKSGQVEHIPRPLRAYARYRVDSTDGYECLYRRLTDQLRTRKPPLGEMKKLG